jgi:hypothetical protein
MTQNRTESRSTDATPSREKTMKHYVLNVVQPDGPRPPQERLDQIMRDMSVVLQQMKDSGAWVFSGGLTLPPSATVVRAEGTEFILTDGPFAEGKEHIGGLLVLRAPDLDAALEWARKTAKAIPLPIEVRAFTHLD